MALTHEPWWSRPSSVGALVRLEGPSRVGILLGSRRVLRPASPERQPCAVLDVLDGAAGSVVTVHPWCVLPVKWEPGEGET